MVDMPWVRNARQNGTGGTATATTHTVPIPTCEVGDDLWASFTLNGGHGAVTDPAGWTRIFPTTITDDTFMTLLIYRKKATATEVAGGNVSVTVAVAVRGDAGSISLVGVETSAAPDGVVTATGTGGNTSLSLSVTVPVADSMVLSILALDSASENATPTAPLVQQWDAVEAGITGQANAGATVRSATAGSVSVQWTWTNNVARKGWSASLRSAPVLAVGDAVQAQTSDTVSITFNTALAAAAASQAQTSDTVALTLNVGAADTVQAFTSDTVTLVAGGVDLVLGSPLQALTSDTVRLSVGPPIDLIASNATQAQTSGTATLTQLHQLATADASQAVTSDSAAITVATTLAVGAAAQTQTADALVLTISGFPLTVSDPAQAQTSDTATLTQLHQLATPAPASQVMTSDTVAIGQIHQLTVAPAVQAVASDVAPLTVTYLMTVAGATHPQTASGPKLVPISQTFGQIDRTPRPAASMAAQTSRPAASMAAQTSGPSMAAA